MPYGSSDVMPMDALNTNRPEAEHPHDLIEKLEDMVCDDYNRCKLFSFCLKGDARRWLNQLPTES
ncbi:hypothetical protein DY000_02015530 [Brassica cretica]|uniref:Retrotransposon gag domain-containing protein n=1 Tax=Brassica cretica TaxID=69181 RepID=A0ABQ7D4L5_BRACR|nr:hypothetical protein DY000_02015530 [Brassica cretica]